MVITQTGRQAQESYSARLAGPKDKAEIEALVERHKVSSPSASEEKMRSALLSHLESHLHHNRGGVRVHVAVTGGPVPEIVGISAMEAGGDKKHGWMYGHLAAPGHDFAKIASLLISERENLARTKGLTTIIATGHGETRMRHFQSSGYVSTERKLLDEDGDYVFSKNLPRLKKP